MRSILIMNNNLKQVLAHTSICQRNMSMINLYCICVLIPRFYDSQESPGFRHNITRPTDNQNWSINTVATLLFRKGLFVGNKQLTHLLQSVLYPWYI